RARRRAGRNLARRCERPEDPEERELLVVDRGECGVALLAGEGDKALTAVHGADDRRRRRCRAPRVEGRGAAHDADAALELRDEPGYGVGVGDVGPAVTNANTVSWFVAEFESGVSVVRGTSTFNAGSATPSAAPVIGTVDCSKSFVALAGEQSDTALTSINDEEFTFLGVLGTFAAPCQVAAGTTTSTLTLSRLATTNAATVAWQVVTMDGATVVARNTATIAINALTANPALPLSTS